jgi:hypothetical protein
MYHTNIDLILTFLGLFLITNVLGTPKTSNLARNPTSISELATENPTTLRSNISSDHFKLRGA